MMSERRSSKWRRRASWLGLLITLPTGVVVGIAGLAAEGDVAVSRFIASAINFVGLFLCVLGILRSRRNNSVDVKRATRVREARVDPG